jgi:hypothetical protein
MDGGRDKRASLRRAGKPVEILISLPGGKGGPAEGLVVDRSRDGLRILAPRAFPAETVLFLRTTQYPDVAEWVPVEVRRCCPAGDRWLLGCRFQSPQPWKVLLLFG